MKIFNFDEALVAMQSELLDFAYRLTTDKHDAEDLLQDTMLKALNNKDKFDPDTNFKSWMYVIMRNTFINTFRAKKYRESVYQLSETEHPVASKDDSFAFVDSRHDAKEIRSVIKTLPKGHYITLMLYVSGFKYQEIAQKIGIPLGTVKNRIFQSRKLLKELLSDFF